MPEYAYEVAAAEFEADPLPPEPMPAKAGVRKLRLLTLDDLEAMPDPRFTVEGLIPEKALATVYGPPKQGKTFLVLSLAAHVAAGVPWFGREVEPGGVVNIAGEGAGGLSTVRGHCGPTTACAVRCRSGCCRAPSISAKAVGDLASLIRETAGPTIKFLVIDTLARATPGMDENSASDMGQFVAECDRLKEEFGCTVLVGHHSGRRQQGWPGQFGPSGRG